MKVQKLCRAALSTLSSASKVHDVLVFDCQSLGHFCRLKTLWDMLRAVGIPGRNREHDDLFGSCLGGGWQQTRRQFGVSFNNLCNAPNLDAPTIDLVDEEKMGLGVVSKIAA